MKKLIIAAAILCAAVISQAATCNWNSGNIMTVAGENGGWSSTMISTSMDVANMAVYLIDLETYNSLAGKTQKELYDAYSTKTASLTGTSLGENPTTHAPIYKGAVVINEPASTALEAIEYAVVIATYHDANLDKDFYIANTAQSVYNGSTKVGNALNVINARGAAATDGGWQTVPEPTSGLLLLLGVAGLALRRRRA